MYDPYLHIDPISISSFGGKTPNLTLYFPPYHIQHGASAQPLDCGWGWWLLHPSHDKLRFSCSCKSERCQPLGATLKDDPWLYIQMDVYWHSSADKSEWKKKDSYWKWIYEKSPIPYMIIEEKTSSMLIKEWWTQVETKLIRQPSFLEVSF